MLCINELNKKKKVEPTFDHKKDCCLSIMLLHTGKILAKPLQAHRDTTAVALQSYKYKCHVMFRFIFAAVEENQRTFFFGASDGERFPSSIIVSFLAKDGASTRPEIVADLHTTLT